MVVPGEDPNISGTLSVPWLNLVEAPSRYQALSYESETKYTVTMGSDRL